MKTGETYEERGKRMDAIGREIARTLGLSQKANGRYDTVDGDKTLVGLYLTMKTIVGA